MGYDVLPGVPFRRKVLEIRGMGQNLLPGIPDEIVLDHITPKLPWDSFYLLSSVSRGWEQAIQRRQVYDARVLTHSTETLVVVHTHNCEGIHEISLYSMRDKARRKLPPIPQYFHHIDMPMHSFLMQSYLNANAVRHRGIPSRSQCIPLDGKIYALGGLKMQYPYCVACDEVYVLDLAGQGQWKQCASMREPRREFGCGVIDGRIFVFGGFSVRGPICGVEVYDPKVNTWSPIMPMTSLRLGVQVTTVGEDIFVYGGEFYDSVDSQGAENKGIDSDDMKEALFVEVYHPGKNEWRKVEAFGKHGSGKVFTAQGKFHSMTGLDIHVYDTEEKTWTQLQSFSFTAIESLTAQPIGILVLDDELLAVVRWYKPNIFSSGSCLLQSRGFCGKIKEIVWQRLPCSLDDSFGYPSVYSIQL